MGLQTEKQRKEEEEEAKRAEKEREEAEDSPPQHGYASKLRKIGGRARGTSAMPKRMGKMRPQVTSTPNTQKKRKKRGGGGGDHPGRRQGRKRPRRSYAVAGGSRM